MDDRAELLSQIWAARRELTRSGPTRKRNVDGDDFARVTLPEGDCDALRDVLAAERISKVVEIGLAYGRSALAIGEALVLVGGEDLVHVVIDPYQEREYFNEGWNVLRTAGLERICELILEPSQIVLPRLMADGLTADAAFVDGSHEFHNVFVDLYYLGRIVRPGGLVVLDDHWWPSVATAARYYETNLGWEPVAGAFDSGTVDSATGQPRVWAFRLPDPPPEPPFTAFQPF